MGLKRFKWATPSAVDVEVAVKAEDEGRTMTSPPSILLCTAVLLVGAVAVAAESAYAETPTGSAAPATSASDSPDAPTPAASAPPGPGPAQVPAGAPKYGPDNAVRMNLTMSDGDASGTWSLMTASGQLLCRLPCAQWVGPGSHYYVQKDEGDSSSLTEVPLPDDISYPAGSTVDAKAIPSRGSVRASVIALVLSTSLVVTGSIMAATAQPSICPENASGYCPANAVPAILLATAGGIGFLVGGIWWLVSHDAHLDFAPLPQQKSANAGSVLNITPDGLAFRF
jgi:hypothetical protein